MQFTEVCKGFVDQGCKYQEVTTEWCMLFVRLAPYRPVTPSISFGSVHAWRKIMRRHSDVSRPLSHVPREVELRPVRANTPTILRSASERGGGGKIDRCPLHWLPSYASLHNATHQRRYGDTAAVFFFFPLFFSISYRRVCGVRTSSNWNRLVSSIHAAFNS